MLALGKALTENCDCFLKGFIPQKTKQHSPVRHQHSGSGTLRRLEAGAVHQDALTSAWLMVIPACLSIRLHGPRLLYQHRHWGLPAGDQQCKCHGLGTPAVCKSHAAACVGERESVFPVLCCSPTRQPCSSRACDLKHHPNRFQRCGFPRRGLAAGSSCGSDVAVISVPELRGSSLFWGRREGILVLLLQSSFSISPALLMRQGRGAEVRKSCFVAYCYTDSNLLMAYCSTNARPHTMLRPAAVIVY